MKLLKSDLDKILTADFDKGILTWKYRTEDMFSDDGTRSAEWRCRLFNAKCGGKEAFTYVNDSGYKVGTIWSKQYKAHRVIWCLMYGDWPKGEIDHINHIKTDNRIANLRDVSGQENMRNMLMNKRNTTGYAGVTFHKNTGKFVAQINIKGVKTGLGYYERAEDAGKAYLDALEKYKFHSNHGKDSL